MITVKIPVMYQPIDDPAIESTTQESAAQKSDLTMMTEKTPVVVLNNHSIYLGDLESFSSGFAYTRNKIEIPHREGSPQVGLLLIELDKWKQMRKNQFNIKPSRSAVLIPGEQWPVAVIIQIIEYLKTSGGYKNIILGAGIH